MEIPVIVGVGELIDRPSDLRTAREPLALMAAALRAAEGDAGTALVRQVDSLDIINEISWPYPDPAAQLCALLEIAPARAVYGPVGGQTPLKAIHEAALAIARGAVSVAAVCGAEAESSVRRAQREGITLPWQPRVEDFHPVRGADFQRPLSVRLGIASPVAVYPLYENATRAAWGLSFAEAQAESGLIWSNNASVAAARETAWTRRDITPAGVVTPSPDNRLIAWPYTKLMTANPMVNQGAAVILTSLANARRLGIAEDRCIFPWGGGAADEARDIMLRPGYTESTAMRFSLDRAAGLLAASSRSRFDLVELYSCFPCVPKMARRVLGLAAEQPLSVTGGLTFFGAPLNNYMAHATVAMVRALRAGRGATGLLYGQGEYVTKHHSLVLGTTPPAAPLDPDYRQPEPAPEAPPILDHYEGDAAIESFTVLYHRDGAARHGVVIARTPRGERLMARVPASDASGIAFLESTEGTPVGALGHVATAADGIGEWRRADG